MRNLEAQPIDYDLWIDDTKQETIHSAVIVIPGGIRYNDGGSCDLVVYAEDENGNVINFASVDEAQAWIDAYGNDALFHIENRDELHATPVKKED